MEKFSSLKDKIVLVSGGTRGIGYAIVKGFLNNGAKVALLGSRKESVGRALEKLKAENADYAVVGYYPDLNKEQEIKEMLEELTKQFHSSVDILVNNAGVSDAKSIFDYDDEHFSKVMNINVDAMFRLTRLCVPQMKEKGKGAVINTSSMVSLYAQGSGSAYPTSKFAVNGMTKALARELGKDGIRVNAVAPGITATDMVKALDQKIVQRMAANIPLQRLGEGEDIANAVLFLASDAAAYITGAVLSVDGGFVG
ncbi:MAG: SDR family oxidoreductase [Erysipelotrichaceae bacterium]|nr:SDR family oxidoreductase [Erysipelotrichaceae bacterium]